MMRFFFAAVILFSSHVFALDLELTEGVSKAFPIGIEGFGFQKEAETLTQVISHDLKLSGQFKLISAPHVSGVKTPLDLWQQVGVDSVLSGAIRRLDDGPYSVHF